VSVECGGESGVHFLVGAAGDLSRCLPVEQHGNSIFVRDHSFSHPNPTGLGSLVAILH
jgi:hypothetical protein